MGYTTDFSGGFGLDKPLTKEHKRYLQAFSMTRRMRRDAKKTAKLPDSIRVAAGLPVGPEGAYYVGACIDEPNDRVIAADYGQGRTDDITDYNSPPDDQPSLWCQWTASDDGESIVWDEGEKFYSYVEWIEYLIEHFLAPWGYVVNGEVEWSGEESDDRGMIRITNNMVKVLQGKIVYE
jgi:hypothetical protein